MGCCGDGDVVLQEGGWDFGLGPRAFVAAQLNGSMNEWRFGLYSRTESGFHVT
jgi:hypothetical protein